MQRNSPIVVLAEKVLWTYVQAFIMVLVVGDVLNTSTLQAAAIAAIPAAITTAINALPAVPTGLPFYVDLTLRVIRTYVAAFLGLLVALPTFELSYSVGVAAAAGAIPAALAVLKGGLAAKVGNRSSAALLPAAVDAGS